MPLKFDAQEFDAALRQLNPFKREPASVAVPASNEPKVAWHMQQSEEVKMRVIAARVKLKLMRDRSEALQDSLQRFRSQHRVVNG